MYTSKATSILDFNIAIYYAQMFSILNIILKHNRNFIMQLN